MKKSLLCLVFVFSMLFTGTVQAAPVVASSPFGGSMTVDADGWLNNAGTVKMTYNNYGLGVNGWTYAGSWEFAGSISPATGYLTGTLEGNWAIGGLTLVAGASNPTYKIVLNFANGNASGKISFSMQYGGMVMPLSFDLNFKQGEVLGILGL